MNYSLYILSSTVLKELRIQMKANLQLNDVNYSHNFSCNIYFFMIINHHVTRIIETCDVKKLEG